MQTRNENANAAGNIELLICADCAIAAAIDDYTGMDDTQETHVRAGLERLGGYVVVGVDCGFTHSGCQCCLGHTGGDKYTATVMFPPETRETVIAIGDVVDFNVGSDRRVYGTVIERSGDSLKIQQPSESYQDFMYVSQARRR